MAGAVYAVVEAGLLRITGDDVANTVYVQRDYDNPDPSALEVDGRDATPINGVITGKGDVIRRRVDRDASVATTCSCPAPTHPQ